MDSLERARSDGQGLTAAAPLAASPALSDRDLSTIMRLVYEASGITLHKGKRALVTARLQKVLKGGGFSTFREYLRHLQSDSSGEALTGMIDAIATNHTAFFREPQHFDFLSTVVLPPLRARAATMPILGWSAACSSGEEPYTIGISAFEQMGDEAAHSIRLLATDLSTKALVRAAAGVYKTERVAGLPRHLMLKYFDRLTTLPPGTVRISEAVRRLVEFRQHNLLEAVPAARRFDFIFCRNAMIYFDRPVQQRVIHRLEERLAPGGYLFTSHSESLNGLNHGLTWVAPAVYRRDRA